MVDKGRNHSVVIDLPEAKGGINSGPTIHEIAVMGFGGCVGTIFAMVAQKMHLHFDKMEVGAEARQKDDPPTITDIHFVLRIQTAADLTKVQKCVELTLKTCPVGILYQQAEVRITHDVEML